MLKRIAVAASAVAAVGLLGTATAASAQATRAAPPGTVVHLHQAYLRALVHARTSAVSGIVYGRGRQPRPAKRLATCTEPNCPLRYGGGQVQHSPRVYLLLWGPKWATVAGEKATASYLKDFYAGLGVGPHDNWSTITSQYGDSTGYPDFFGSVYQGAFYDSTTPPSGATAAQLGAEAAAFAANQGITTADDPQIVVATQSGTCPQGFVGSSCGGGGTYCAWHSVTPASVPYVNLPYLLDAGTLCGKDFVNSTGTHDGFSMVGGAEYADMITDPVPQSAWWDPADSVTSGEIGDKCAWGGSRWGGSDPSGDVTLSTGKFAMQSLWSNIAGHCVMSAPQRDNVTVTQPASQSGNVGTKTSLQMQGTSSGGLPLTWSAGGLPAGLSIGASTGLISGTPTTSKNYTVTVTATDSTGGTGSAKFTWTIGSAAGRVLGYKGRCLDDRSGSTTNGNKIDIWTCNGTGAQTWTFGATGTLSVLGKCVADKHYTGAGTKLALWPCVGHRNERWAHLANGQYKLALNGLCLTDPSNSIVNGTQVELRACHDFRGQRWSAP
jgi:putative Ig domain-containing protein/ricin-type beta-trefoil lectin protein